MALYNSGVLWNSGAKWGPAVPDPISYTNDKNNRNQNTVKRQYYYPRKVADQPPWHFNYAGQLTELGVGIGLALDDVTASANDSKHLGYAIGDWLKAVRDFGPAASGQVEVLRYGTGTAPFVLPEFIPLPPPTGLTAVLPGALARIFKFVKMIKGAPGYTEGIGLLLGVVGSEIPPPPPGSGTPPRISLSLNQIPSQQQVLIKFFKDGHDGVWIESRRGTGPWEFLTISTKSPHIDTRELLSPTVAEVREYRAMFWDQGQPNGDWSGVEKITVSP